MRPVLFTTAQEECIVNVMFIMIIPINQKVKFIEQEGLQLQQGRAQV